MLKLASTVQRLDSGIASKSCHRGDFWRPGDKKRQLSGFRRRWPPTQSWQALLQQLALDPHFLSTGTSAGSCGINTSAERTLCPPLSSNKEVIQGGHWKAQRMCDTGQLLTACTVAGIWHLIPADFCFLVSLPLRSVSQTLTLLPSAQHASYHVTGIYHFTSAKGGVLWEGGVASSADATLQSQLSQTGYPLWKTLAGLHNEQELSEIENCTFVWIPSTALTYCIDRSSLFDSNLSLIRLDLDWSD